MSDECWDRLRDALTARVPYLRGPDVQNILDAIADEGLAVIDPKAPAYAPPPDEPEFRPTAWTLGIAHEYGPADNQPGCATEARRRETWRGDQA